MTKTFYISAGHSTSDPGAVNERLNLREADLTRGLRNLIVEKLTEQRASVESDGTGMVNLPRDVAISKAKRVNGIKLDIHFNAAVPSAKGVETFSDSSEKALAQALSLAVATVLETDVRGERGWKGRTESQHGKKGLAWLDNLKRSVLLEVCFISNDREIAKYLSRMDAVANVIVNVLLTFQN